MSASVMARLDGIEEVQRGMAHSLALIATEQKLLSDQVGALVNVLTPDEKKEGGLTMAEVMAAFIGRLDRQNDLLKDMADTVARAVVELPVEVARAVRAAEDNEGEASLG